VHPESGAPPDVALPDVAQGPGEHCHCSLLPKHQMFGINCMWCELGYRQK